MCAAPPSARVRGRGAAKTARELGAPALGADKAVRLVVVGFGVETLANSGPLRSLLQRGARP